MGKGILYKVIKLDETEALLCEDCFGYYQQDLELEHGFVPALEFVETQDGVCDECGLGADFEDENDN